MKRIHQIVPVLLALALMALVPLSQRDRAPSRWAVIVGITDYTAFDDEEGGDLPGAERDARAMRDVLVGRWGLREENVHLLLNGEATRAGIEAALTEWLPERARPGDHVLVYFAGHGSQVWDENGDEDDGLDETIVPADVLPNDPSLDILDDEMGEWLRALPTDLVVYVHDNCNAGTGTRDVTPFSRARLLKRDLDALPRPEGAARRALPGQDGDASGMDLANVEVLELAAAQPNQVAVDAYFQGEDGAESFHGGAFTTFLVQQLWRAPADATYETVFAEVAEALRQHRFQQDPYISGESALKDLPLMWVEGDEASAGGAVIPVTVVRGTEAELGAGLALGLTAGSVVASASGARLRITDATRDRARASIESGAVAEGDRVAVVGYRYPTTRLRVGIAGIDTESGSALQEALTSAAADGRSVGSIQIVSEADAFSELLLRRRGTELRVVGQDGFTRSVVPADAGGIAELVGVLEREAASLRLSAMENPGQTFQVEVSMSGGQKSFGIGEEVTFAVRSQQPGYLTLVDLGTDGTVTLLYPNAEAPQARIGAGETRYFPSESMGFEIRAEPPAGRGMVRAFVTREPLELPLNEDFLSGNPELADAVAEALKTAVGFDGDAVRLEGWATTALVYDITN